MGSAFSDLLYLAIRKNVKLDDKLFRSRCFIDESTIQIGKNNKQVLQNNNSIDYSKFETKKLRNLKQNTDNLNISGEFFSCLLSYYSKNFLSTILGIQFRLLVANLNRISNFPQHFPLISKCYPNLLRKVVSTLFSLTAISRILDVYRECVLKTEYH